MKLTTLVLGTTLVASLAGCAGTKHVLIYPDGHKGCFMAGSLRTCTDYVEGGEQTVVTSFYMGTVNDKFLCGMRGLYPNGWLSIVDQGCDGITDLYQEGNDKGPTMKLQRSDDERFFSRKVDPMLQKAKKDVWKE